MNESRGAHAQQPTHILTEECIRLKFRDANFCLCLETSQKLARSSHSIKLTDSPSVQFSDLFRNVPLSILIIVASRFIRFLYQIDNFLINGTSIFCMYVRNFKYFFLSNINWMCFYGLCDTKSLTFHQSNFFIFEFQIVLSINESLFSKTIKNPPTRASIQVLCEILIYN